MVIYGACLTGKGRSTESNLVNATQSKGASVVIGFEENVWSSEVNCWCSAFFDSLSKGLTIYKACESADSYVAEYWYNEEYPEYDIRTDSWYIAGNSSAKFV